MSQEKVVPRIPRGMRDMLPQTMIRREFVIKVVRRVFEEFGFEPLQTPAVELEETLMGKYGPDAEKLIYKASHRGGRQRLALRYDLSVPLSRVIAQYPDLTKPFKRYQIAPVWRAERPQKGRYREHYQCDVDTVGAASMLADAEILNIIYEVLTRLGFDKFVVNLNDRKLLNGIGQYAGVPKEQLGGIYRSIDKLSKIGLRGVESELQSNNIPRDTISGLLNLLQIEGNNQEILTQLEIMLGDYAEALEGITELREILKHLQALGIQQRYYQVVPSMVRGLEYYTGPIYETMVEEPAIGSITGGGRFDELVGMFMEHSYPATGTTIGLERIIDVMEELNMFPPEITTTVSQVLVTQFSADMIAESLKVARDLRQGGLNTELYFQNDPLGDQFRYALKKGISYVVILGPDEFATEQVTVRNLPLEKQRTVKRSEAVDLIKQWTTG